MPADPKKTCLHTCVNVKSRLYRAPRKPEIFLKSCTEVRELKGRERARASERVRERARRRAGGWAGGSILQGLYRVVCVRARS